MQCHLVGRSAAADGFAIPDQESDPCRGPFENGFCCSAARDVDLGPYVSFPFAV
jgi:hypothetical protein